MNAITPMVDQTVGTPAITDIKHFVLAIDPVTGEEVRIEVVPNGEFSQEDEVVEPTIH